MHDLITCSGSASGGVVAQEKGCYVKGLLGSPPGTDAHLFLSVTPEPFDSDGCVISRPLSRPQARSIASIASRPTLHEHVRMMGKKKPGCLRYQFVVEKPAAASTDTAPYKEVAASQAAKRTQ
jgi:hypothetical protein